MANVAFAEPQPVTQPVEKAPPAEAEVVQAREQTPAADPLAAIMALSEEERLAMFT
jgi:hypothetical protein